MKILLLREPVKFSLLLLTVGLFLFIPSRQAQEQSQAEPKQDRLLENALGSPFVLIPDRGTSFDQDKFRFRMEIADKY